MIALPAWLAITFVLSMLMVAGSFTLQRGPSLPVLRKSVSAGMRSGRAGQQLGRRCVVNLSRFVWEEGEVERVFLIEKSASALAVNVLLMYSSLEISRV